MELFVLKINFTNPLLRRNMPRHTLVSRFIGFVQPLVTSIESFATWAKVISRVIESIAINMVNILFASDYEAMHQNESISSIRFPLHSSNINRFRFLGWDRKPMPLVEEIKIRSTNYSIESACQWDEFDRLVKRLDNSVSLHGAFHKEPSFLVRLSAAPLNSTMLGVEHGIR
jgi:hypothetical protein